MRSQEPDVNGVNQAHGRGTGMEQIEVVHWNPRRPIIKNRQLARVFPVKRPVSNFGDLIGPLVVDLMLKSRGLSNAQYSGDAGGRVLTVGSILHLASDGDTVWGTGWNGKVPPSHHTFSTLDVRAVRGPYTREKLMQRGLECPAVYGDPALLLPKLAPDLFRPESLQQQDVLVVPNLNDYSSALKKSSPFPVLNPQSPLRQCLSRIASSKLVVGSSLHGIVVAESLGIPARLVTTTSEHSLKYDDYFSGTGRETPPPASSIAEAADLGGAPPVEWESGPLIAAFPWDLWTKEAR